MIKIEIITGPPNSDEEYCHRKLVLLQQLEKWVNVNGSPIITAMFINLVNRQSFKELLPKEHNVNLCDRSMRYKVGGAVVMTPSTEIVDTNTNFLLIDTLTGYSPFHVNMLLEQATSSCDNLTEVLILVRESDLRDHLTRQLIW